MVLGLTLLLVSLIYLFCPGKVVTILTYQSPDVIYRVNTTEPVVALTIDDGPDVVTTPKILDVLARHEAQATFFLITSRLSGNEPLVRETVEAGHELGNHLIHDRPSIYLKPYEFEQQLREADALLSSFGDLRWFRPGSGWYNRTMLAIVHRHQYRMALGSVYPFDPHIPSSRFASWYILRHVQPGAIIILHDSGRRGERTVRTLSTVLPELQRRGYRIVTLTELVEMQRERVK